MGLLLIETHPDPHLDNGGQAAGFPPRSRATSRKIAKFNLYQNSRAKRAWRPLREKFSDFETFLLFALEFF